MNPGLFLFLMTKPLPDIGSMAFTMPQQFGGNDISRSET
jgi:hypothetical protein